MFFILQKFVFENSLIFYRENVLTLKTIEYMMSFLFLAITMEAEKNDIDTEKKETINDAAIASVTNEATNLKIDDNTTNSTPGTPGSPSGNESGSFLASFKAFSKFGDTKSDGKLITLSQSDKWMKQAKVIDGKKITTTDTGIYFKKHK